MFAPNSFSCNVTTASPIQMIENTPENTRLDCSADAFIERNMLRSRQKINGPLEHQLAHSSLCFVIPPREQHNIPKIPIPQPLAHPSLQHNIRIRPPSNKSPKPASKSLIPKPTLPSFRRTPNPTTTPRQHSPKQVFRPQHLAHFLPDGKQVAGHGLPDCLVDGILRRAPVFAWDRGREVAAGEPAAASIGRAIG